jgi:hypothetical protein
MINQVLFYIAAGIAIFWGTFHLFPTRNVVRDFGPISKDNVHIITMEWITEGFALIFLGLLVAVVTVISPDSAVSRAVYWLTIGMLNALSILSLFTGFKINFLPYKLCPVLFTGASLLILLGVLL